MEHCNRGDLQNLLKKAKEKNVAGIKEVVLWNIILQIFLGLHYLHTKHVLHRDLKTANVFLTKSEIGKSFFYFSLSLFSLSFSLLFFFSLIFFFSLS